jgi:hypothetical protein
MQGLLLKVRKRKRKRSDARRDRDQLLGVRQETSQLWSTIRRRKRIVHALE